MEKQLKKLKEIHLKASISFSMSQSGNQRRSLNFPNRSELPKDENEMLIRAFSDKPIKINQGGVIPTEGIFEDNRVYFMQEKSGQTRILQSFDLYKPLDATISVYDDRIEIYLTQGNK